MEASSQKLYNPFDDYYYSCYRCHYYNHYYNRYDYYDYHPAIEYVVNCSWINWE